MSECPCTDEALLLRRAHDLLRELGDERDTKGMRSRDRGELRKRLRAEALSLAAVIAGHKHFATDTAPVMCTCEEPSGTDALTQIARKRLRGNR